MVAVSRTSQHLTWGALIGALFLWLVIAFSLELSPSLSWVETHFPLFIVLCFISPVLEEYVFRGLIYDYVEDRNQTEWSVNQWVKISIANLVTTGLFIAMHVGFRGFLAGALVILPSLYLGLIRRESSTLGPCILVHGLWNLGWFSLFPPQSL